LNSHSPPEAELLMGRPRLQFILIKLETYKTKYLRKNKKILLEKSFTFTKFCGIIFMVEREK